MAIRYCRFMTGWTP